MNNLVLKLNTSIMNNDIESILPQLIKCLLFEDVINLDSTTKKLFLNTVYQNRKKLNDDGKKYFDQYVRTSGYYSHSLQNKDNILDELSTFKGMKLSDKQRELANFLNTIDCEYNFLTAPTSFGKTKLVLESVVGKYKKIVFIVPTKALINEYKRNIYNLANNLIVTSNPNQDFAKLEQYIFVCTQERYNISNCNSHEILIVDEAQEIGNINNQRTLEMVIALKNTSCKKIFLCPYVEINSLIGAYQHLLNEKFRYRKFVASEKEALVSKKNFYVCNATHEIHLKYSLNNSIQKRKIDRKFGDSRIDLCLSVILGEKIINKKNIIYSGTKENARNYARKLCDISSEVQTNETLEALIDYFKNEYSEDFEIIEFLKKGIAIHTADIDPFARKVIEYLYNKGESNTINTIVSTSTIAAGVNLQCENLFYINKRRMEPLTQTNNILGRSGRFNIYNVGNNYYFPDIKNTEINQSARDTEKLEKINKSVYDKAPETDIYKDLNVDKDIKRKIFKYYVSKAQYESLKTELKLLEKNEQQSIRNNPLEYKNLVKIFECFYGVTEERLEKSAMYFAVIFGEYLSRKSISQIVEINLSKGLYYNESENIFSNRPIEMAKFINKNNITAKQKNEYLYSKIREYTKNCEFKLKRAITVVLFVLNEIYSDEKIDLKEIYLNFEYDTDSANERDFIIKLSEIGVEDKFLVNKILNDSNLKKKFELINTKQEAYQIIKDKFGEKSYHILSLKI